MKKGFTLVEILVATGVFLIVVTIAMMAFLNVSNIMKKASAIRAINDSISFAMETMAREIRTGYDYCPPGACTTPDAFNFNNREGINIKYYLSDGKINIHKDLGTPYRLTSPDVIINTLEFIVSGQGSGDNLQPMVTIIIQGIAIEGNITSPLNIQTTITQRKIDG